MGIAGCSQNKYSANKILPGRWESISKKGKMVVLIFKANQEVELLHERFQLKSIKGKQKVTYTLDQSVTPNRILLTLNEYHTTNMKTKTLGLIYRILSPDTILIAIAEKSGKFPESFDTVDSKDKTVLVKQPVVP